MCVHARARVSVCMRAPCVLERERACVRAQLRLLCNGAAGCRGGGGLGVLCPVNPCGYIKAGGGGGGIISVAQRTDGKLD